MQDPDQIPETQPQPQAQPLVEAARLAAASGVELDDFMRAAWSAYVDARPGLREQLADQQMRAELAELRKHGRIAAA